MKKITIILLVLFSSFVFGGEIIVDRLDGNNPSTIQAGINAASNGDVVIVMPGTYAENINMSGKAITLRSSDPEDPAIVTSTIINGRKLGSVIKCISGETSETIINGLVITNGYAADGGGMYNENSSPTVINCVFDGNGAYSGVNGVAGVNGSNGAHGTNSNYNGSSGTDGTSGTSGISGGDGGGMYNKNSSPMISNCLFSENYAGNGGNGGNGGRGGNGGNSHTIWLAGYVGNGGNGGDGGNGGNAGDGGRGGGIFNDETSLPIVTDCIFRGNSAGLIGKEGSLGARGTGGQGKVNGSNGIAGVAGTPGQGGIGGGIFNSSSITVVDNLFCRNSPDAINGSSFHPASRNNAIHDFCLPAMEIVKGDLTGDRKVNMDDLAIIGENWLVGVE